MATIIKVKVNDQTLQITNMPKIASGGQNENEIQFEFCSLWDGFGKTAIFYRNENEVYNVVLDIEDKCFIPNEVLTDDGTFYFGVFGTKGKVRRTSEVLNYKVVQGSFILGQEPSEPTPDIYAQLMDINGEILNHVSNIEAIIKDVRFVTQEKFDAIEVREPSIYYVVTDATYEVEQATNAERAEYAEYASDDKSKGTIEERLNALGFKQGAFTIEYSSNGSTWNSVSAEYIITNQITKSGKYCIGNLTINGEFSAFSVRIKIPNEFLPKQNFNVLGNVPLGLGVGTIAFENGNASIVCGNVSTINIVLTNIGWEIK